MIFLRKLPVLWVVIVLAVLSTGGALYTGYRLGQQDPHVVTVKNITNVDDHEVKADFGLFWQVWEKLKEYHVDGEETDEQNLVYGAVAGLVNTLKDPYTVFFPPAEAKKFEEDVKGSFGGIGAEIGVRDEQLVIIAPLKDSPAEAAGLLAKDKILKVDNAFTDGLGINEAVSKIRGEIGTKVTLLILRNGWEKPKEFVITRAQIKVPTIDWDVKEGNILHLKFYAFNENAPNLFYRAVVGGVAKGAKGMVLDMRNNPGGFLDVATHLAGWFLPKGAVIVKEDIRVGEDTIFKADGNAALKDFPVVVLVNGGSASASEILAGALRDNRGIKLIGEKTFGKGSVQELVPLKSASSVKITVANWFTPNGTKINGTGLEPDIKVKIPDVPEDGKDYYLDKAIEVLKKK